MTENSLKSQTWEACRSRYTSNDFYSWADVTSKHRSYSEMSANKNSLSFSAGTISTALEEDYMHSSVPETKKLTSSPLLYVLMKANSPDCSSSPDFKNTQPEKPTANIDQDATSQVKQVKSLATVLNGEHTEAQNLDRLGGSHLDCCQPPFSFFSLSGQMANEPPTDDQIRDFIKKRLACYTNVSTTAGQAHKDESSKSIEANFVLTPKSAVASEKQTGTLASASEHSNVASEKQTGTLASASEHSNYASKNEPVKKSASIVFNLPFKRHTDVTMFTNACGKSIYAADCADKTFGCTESFHSKWVDKYIENGIANLHYSLTALKELIGSLEKVEIIAEVENFSEVILQQYWGGDIDNIHLFTSTEYPQIMGKVAATCTKNEDESPVVLTAVAPMTLDELTEKHSNSLFDCGSSHEEINKSFKTYSKMCKNLDVHTQPVEAMGSKSIQGVTDVSEAFKSETSLIVHKNGTYELENQDYNRKTGEMFDPQLCQIQIVNVVSLNTNQQLCQKCEDSRKDAGLLHSERASKNEVRELPSESENEHEQAFSVNNIKDLQYEDISDDENTLQLKKLSTSKLRGLACFEGVQYDYISEDENPQSENFAVETVPPLKPPEKNKQLTFKNEGYGHMLSESKVKLVDKMIPKTQQRVGFVDTDPPSSSLDNTAEPLSHPKSDCKRRLECHTNCSSVWSPFSDENDDQMDFDDWIVLPISISDLKFEPEEEAQDDPAVIVLQDSDTESIKSLGDTNPKEQMLHQPASEPGPVSDHSQIEEFDTLESFLKAKCAQFRRSSKSTPTMEMDPTTEPHTAQNHRESNSQSEDNCETDDSCNYSPPHEHNYLTVTNHLLKTPAHVTSDQEDSVPKKENEHEATHAQTSQMRHSTLQKLKDMMSTKAVQPSCNKQIISKNEDIIILDSDTESECEQNCRKRETSSQQDGSCDQRKRHLPKTVDNLAGTLFEKEKAAQEFKLDSNRQHISTQQSIIILDSDTEDESDKNFQKAKNKGLFFSESKDCGDMRKTKQFRLKEKASTQTSSQREVFHGSDKVGQNDCNYKKKATIVRTLSSESDNCGSASLTIQNSQSTKKTQSPGKTPQSVDKEADSLCHNPVIPRLYVQKSTQSSKYLKLAKQSNGTFDKDKTLPLKTSTATSKRQESESGNKRLINVAKLQAGVVSRQPSLSNQEHPSTSKSNLTSTDGQLSKVRRSLASTKYLSSERSAFQCHPERKQSSSGPTPSSKLKRSCSCGSTSALENTHPLAQGPPSSAAMQLPAKKRAVEDWSNSYFPLRRDRRRSLGNARPPSRHRDRTPRQRHNSHKSTNPLMKKAKFEAIQWTKDKNRDTSREKRSSVGKGFKNMTLSRPNNRVGCSGETKRYTSLSGPQDPVNVKCKHKDPKFLKDWLFVGKKKAVTIKQTYGTPKYTVCV